ncbi:Undecaprenyl-diphosphatase [Candidatus Hepatincola sp. Pdp]
MNFLHVIILSFIQGFSEMLPISSSGHLVIAHYLITNLPTESLYFDIGLHVGTLIAVILVFWQDTIFLIQDGIRLICLKKINNPISKNIIIGTIPVVIFGFLFELFGIEDYIRILPIIAFNLIFFGILLYLADKYSKNNTDITKLSLKNAFFIGCAQVLALIPGVSRSGICITTGRYVGMQKTDSVRFSMLLSIPAITAAACANLLHIKNTALAGNDLILGIIFSFIFGFLFIKFLLEFVRRFSFKIFMIYRIIIGLILVAYIFLV